MIPLIIRGSLYTLVKVIRPGIHSPAATATSAVGSIQQRCIQCIHISGAFYHPLGKGGYVFSTVGWSVCHPVCLSVCAFVCFQHHSKNYEQIAIKFYGRVRSAKKNTAATLTSFCNYKFGSHCRQSNRKSRRAHAHVCYFFVNYTA